MEQSLAIMEQAFGNGGRRTNPRIGTYPLQTRILLR